MVGGADCADVLYGALKKSVEYCIRDSNGGVFWVIDHHRTYSRNLLDIIHDGLIISD